MVSRESLSCEGCVREYSGVTNDRTCMECSRFWEYDHYEPKEREHEWANIIITEGAAKAMEELPIKPELPLYANDLEITKMLNEAELYLLNKINALISWGKGIEDILKRRNK